MRISESDKQGFFHNCTVPVTPVNTKPGGK